ncbi:hypothetical protein SDC9_78375 [bioreactor metagenome]|uniref:Uncharacterized protein n=1 Tax=bioreactor metagenome TaxID=1076179 RepID=A0A644YV08_9ZZZZ
MIEKMYRLGGTNLWRKNKQYLILVVLVQENVKGMETVRNAKKTIRARNYLPGVEEKKNQSKP